MTLDDTCGYRQTATVWTTAPVAFGQQTSQKLSTAITMQAPPTCGRCSSTSVVVGWGGGDGAGGCVGEGHGCGSDGGAWSNSWVARRVHDDAALVVVAF